MCFSFALTKRPCSHSTPSYWDEETVGWRAPTFFPRIDPGKKDSRSEDTRVAADTPVRPTLGTARKPGRNATQQLRGVLQPRASSTSNPSGTAHQTYRVPSTTRGSDSPSVTSFQ